MFRYRSDFLLLIKTASSTSQRSRAHVERLSSHQPRFPMLVERLAQTSAASDFEIVLAVRTEN